MRKFTLLFAATIALATFSNNVFGKPQAQSFFFSLIQEIFKKDTNIPLQASTEIELNVQHSSWLQYFIFQQEWFSSSEKTVATDEIKTETLPVKEENIILSQKETTKTIVTPTSTTVITRTSKITTKPEPVNIGEMMQLIEEVGAGATY